MIAGCGYAEMHAICLIGLRDVRRFAGWQYPRASLGLVIVVIAHVAAEQVDPEPALALIRRQMTDIFETKPSLGLRAGLPIDCVPPAIAAGDQLDRAVVAREAQLVEDAAFGHIRVGTIRVSQ